MARAKNLGQGWHKQSIRHSNAKTFGKAGGTYSSDLLKKGMREEREHEKTLQDLKNDKISVKKAEEQIARDHLSKRKDYYEENPSLPIADKAELPVQFSLTIPSTKNVNEPIGKRGLDKRVHQENKWLIDRFYGDTTIKGKGDYESNGRIIHEDVAVIEVSTDKESWNKHRAELAQHIKQRRKEWGQKQMAYTLEGNLYLYPKDPEKTPL